MIFKLRQNDVDPSPEARKQFQAAVDFVFKFAEYFLIAGVFGYLAAVTMNWAVIAIALILGLLVSTQLMALVSGLDYLAWKEMEGKPRKFVMWFLDGIIFFAVLYTLWTAAHAVGEVMLEGIGI